MCLSDYVTVTDINISNVKIDDKIKIQDGNISKVTSINKYYARDSYVYSIGYKNYHGEQLFNDVYENGKSFHNVEGYDIVKVFYHKTNVITNIIFPSDKKVYQVEVWVDIPTEEDDASGYSIIGCNGPLHSLAEIEKQLNEEMYEMFTKSGIYLLEVSYCAAQLGDYGMVEISEYFDITFIAYRDHSVQYD